MSSGISNYNTQTGLKVNNPEYPAIDEYSCNTCTGGSGGGGCCVPVNGIIMYNDTDVLFPNYVLEGATWNICDGNNGTIDLRNRFVYGNDSNANLGTTGGAASVVISVAQLPSHTHSIPALGVSGITAGPTGGAGSVNHDHNNCGGTWGFAYWCPNGAPGAPLGLAAPMPTILNNDPASPCPAYAGGGGSSGGNTTGGVAGTGGTLATHTHTWSGATPVSTTGATGSGTALDILNPYVKLYFIQRTL